MPPAEGNEEEAYDPKLAVAEGATRADEGI